MKSNFPPKNLRAASLVLVAALAALPTANAASGTWNGTVSGNWTDSTRWVGGNVPNGTSEVATLSGNRTSVQTITLVSPVTVGNITASSAPSAAGGLTITGSTLTLANGANQPVIYTGPDSGFNESAATRLKISSVLDGTNGFERTGSGYLDLSGVTNVFTGTIKLTAPTAGGGSFTVINSDANLGNSANVITVATNTQPVGFYNDASAGSFTLNSARTITTSGTGDFWVKNKAGANMTIAGVISGTARLRKNDAGILTLSNANTYTGGTFIEGGTLTLAGGNNRIPSNSTVTFGNGATLNVGNTTQTISSIVGPGTTTVTGNYTVNGIGGKLLINGDVQFTASGSNATLVNMAGLSEFEYNRSNRNFVVQPITSATGNPTSTTELRLASDGIGKNTITAAAVTVGTASSSNGVTNLAILRLGKDNAINTGNISIGGFNGAGTINFNTGLTNPTVTLRGLTGGNSAITSLKVGETSSGTRSGAGTLDLTGGSLDAIVTDLVVNRHVANSTNGVTSSVTMPAGSLVASTILLGEKTGTGALTLTTNFNQGGGTVKVSTLTFGKDAGAGASPDFRSSYNLSGGTLSAATIEAGTGAFATTSVRRIGWTGGTIANFDASTDLTINGVSGAGGSITLATSTAAAKAFDVSAGRSITLGANTALTGSAALTKSGDGSLIFASGATHTYSGSFGITGGTVVVDSGANIGTAAITVGSGATLRVNGSITNAITINGGKITGAGTLGADLGLNTLSDVVSPGNSPGIQSFGVTQNWTSFTYDWEINNFTGVAGTNFDQIAITTGGLNLTGGTSYVLNVLSLTALNTSGAVPGFSESSVSWSVVSTQSGITAFDAGNWTINDAAFKALTGATGTFSLAVNGNSLDLTYTPIPEPSAYTAMVGLGAVGLALYRRRRQFGNEAKAA